jgi:hypothetical protein
MGGSSEGKDMDLIKKLRAPIYGVFISAFALGGYWYFESQKAAESISFASHGRPKKHFGGRHSCQQTGNQHKQCYKETHEQPVHPTTAVDVLFVVQTSDSISQERAGIVNEIQSFIASLPEGADFNVAVMLSHGSTSDYSGKLFQAGSEPLVLMSSLLSNADIQSGLNAKLTSAVPDNDSGGGEEGIYSLFRGITNSSLLQASQAAGFFRPEAALAVVFIADQRDICANVPVGALPETDPLKIAARIRDCEGITPQGLTSQLNNLKGSSPLAVSGIIYADQPPADAENEISYGYVETIALNDGVAIDIINDDISQGLAAIAALSGDQMSIQQAFVLEHSGADPATVKVNGESAPFQFDGGTVTVTQDIQAGALVEISYCIKSTEKSKCEHHHGRRYHHMNHHDWKKDDKDHGKSHSHYQKKNCRKKK